VSGSRRRAATGRILNLERGSDHARWLDERDARVPLSRSDLESDADRAAAAAVKAGGDMQAVIEATGMRTRENVLRNIDPAILAETAGQGAAKRT
jgi:hypothetical protein